MFQVRGWTGAYASNYEDALAAGPQNGANKAGKSGILRVDTGDPNDIHHTPPTLYSYLQPFALATVPEPSPMLLALLAAPALFLLRNRERS